MATCTKPVGVYSLTPFTQLDYPGELACIVWFAGCNLRCAYCHNPEMVRSVGIKPWDEILAFLQQRQGRLTGVVFSGGEATLHPHLVSFAKDVKALGYKLKLDTNGTRPDVVQALVAEGLLDMVAMDYKAPRPKFKQVTGLRESLWDAFGTTLDLLIHQSQIALDIRTTVHTDLLNEIDILAIQDDLKQRGYTGTYHVQNYRHGETLGNLEPQKIILNQAFVATPRKVRVAFRNF